MPSKQIYKTVFDEETENYEIRVTDEFGSPQTEFKFESATTIESARRLMEDLKARMHDETVQDPFREIVYISPDHFEVINHRD